MGDTNFRGPVISMGATEIDSGTGTSVQPFDGPSASYQGYALLDPHGAYQAVSTPNQGGAGFMINPSFIAIDTVPQAFSTSLLAAAQIASIGSTVANCFSSGRSAMSSSGETLPSEYSASFWR